MLLRMKNSIFVSLGAICALTFLCSFVPIVDEPVVNYCIAPLVLGALIAGEHQKQRAKDLYSNNQKN